MKTFPLIISVLAGAALLPGLAAADTLNWATISYAPTAATAVQRTQVQSVNGTNISVLFSNSTYDSTFVQSPGSGSYAATQTGNTNPVYTNGGGTSNYGLQLVTNFSTSTNAGSSGNFIGGASDTVTIFFSKPVLNIAFQFYDIDQGTISGGVYTDYVSNIFGLGTGGATVAPITLTHGMDNMLWSTGNIATTGFIGTASANENSSDGNASVVFGSTPITQFSFTYGDTATAGSAHSPIQLIALGNVNYSVAPEPSTWAMLGVGAAAAVAAVSRKRRRASALAA